jgi:hypothetical protein
MTQTLVTQPSVSTVAVARSTDEPAGIEPRSAAEIRAALIRHGLLALLGIMFLAPLAWLFFASVDANASWPQFTLDNFRAVTRGDFLEALFSTFLLSLVATAVSTITATFGGYALSRRRGAGLPRRPGQLRRGRRQAGSAAGRANGLGPPAAERTRPPDLRHSVLPVPARGDDADGAALPTHRHRAPERRLDPRG